MLQMLTDPLLSLIYPQQCSVCSSTVNRRRDGKVCGRCWASAETFTGLETLCVKCGAFLSKAEPLFETHCHACEEHLFDKARAVGPYEGPLAKTILDMKSVPYLPSRVTELMASQFFDQFEEDITLLIPVPLSRQRYRERGFNQAELIARRLSARINVQVDSHSLVRRLHTDMHRAGMDKKARQMSVRNAFEVKRPRLIEGQSILLVDDVLTSGATASACAKVLKQNGAALVNILTIGRAV